MADKVLQNTFDIHGNPAPNTLQKDVSGGQGLQYALAVQTVDANGNVVATASLTAMNPADSLLFAELTSDGQGGLSDIFQAILMQLRINNALSRQILDEMNPGRQATEQTDDELATLWAA